MSRLLSVIPRGSARFALAGAALAIMALLSSCSNPPAASKRASAPGQPKVTESERSQPSAHVTEQKLKSGEADVERPTKPVEPSRGHKRLANGVPSELSHFPHTNKIAITLDAGASAAPTPSILSTLKSAGVHVTFFLTGKWCEQNPQLVKEIAADGHEIGNHTYSHPDLRKVSDDAIRDQLAKAETLVVNLTGKSTKPFFRPPFGARDKRVLGVAADDGYRCVYWSLDSLDAFKKGITGQEIEERVLSRAKGGDIILMHCGSAPTAAVLPDVIEKLKQRGFDIVTISELTSGN